MRVADPPLDLSHADTGGQLRDLVSSPEAGCLMDDLFDRCGQLLVFSRHHWLKFRGEYRLRADLRSILDDLRSRSPQTWEDDESELLLCCYALASAAVGLEQLREVITAQEVRHVLDIRLSSYLEALGQVPRSPETLRLVGLALRVKALRPQVEQLYYRVSNIDGEAWHRAESLIPRRAVDTQTVPAPLAAELAAGGGPLGLDELLPTATRVVLDEHGHSAPLLRAIMRAAVTDPALRVDHVTITCPRGYLLDTPELMTGSEAFFTETEIRPDVDLDSYREQIGHASDDRLRKTVRARMLKLKRKAAAGFYGAGCLHGQFVEKGADYMIFRNEDAHYRGHQSVGCSTGGRAAYPVRYRIGEDDRELPPMMGDFRVVRLSHAPEDLFTAAELVHVIRYAACVRAVVEETIRLGGVVLESATGGLDLHGKDGQRNASLVDAMADE